MSKADKPVHARPVSMEPGAGGKIRWAQDGISYREWLVGMILSGMNATQYEPEFLAARAVRLADLAIAELEEKP